jgi:hypothetical protein
VALEIARHFSSSTVGEPENAADRKTALARNDYGLTAIVVKTPRACMRMVQCADDPKPDRTSVYSLLLWDRKWRQFLFNFLVVFVY